MTTKVTVHGAVTVTSLAARAHGEPRETEEQRGNDVGGKAVASFPVHNTLSVRLEGNGKATVEASDWPVTVTQGDTTQTVEPGDTLEVPLVGVAVLIAERGEDEPEPEAEPAAA